MHITIVGTGYAGLVSGACFAGLGNHVTCVDTDAAKIARLQQGDIPIFEAGLADLVKEQLATGRLHFTTSLETALKESEIIFIAVGTPPNPETGQADMRFVYEVVASIGKSLNHYAAIVTKSTVPVGTAAKLEAIIKQANPAAECDICSNPEFLREGTAIKDFMHPERIVIGCNSLRARDLLAKLYKPFTDQGISLLQTGRETAEIIKYASNAFLATKLSFINEIADLCEAADANIEHVAHAMGLDTRIGSKFLQAGPGYGGSCLPKDTLALTQTGRSYATPQTIIEAVITANQQRRTNMLAKIVAACGGTVRGKKIAVWGLSFKPETDDMREAPALAILPALQELGGDIHAHDPAALHNAEAQLPQLTYHKDALAAAKDADALLVLTEWAEYKNTDLDSLKTALKTACVIDLRNIFSPALMREKGFHYTSIGRASVKPDT